MLVALWLLGVIAIVRRKSRSIFTGYVHMMPDVYNVKACSFLWTPHLLLSTVWLYCLLCMIWFLHLWHSKYTKQCYPACAYKGLSREKEVWPWDGDVGASETEFTKKLEKTLNQEMLSRDPTVVKLELNYFEGRSSDLWTQFRWKQKFSDILRYFQILMRFSFDFECCIY
jgi:hypothetical protein